LYFILNIQFIAFQNKNNIFDMKTMIQNNQGKTTPCFNMPLKPKKKKIKKDGIEISPIMSSEFQRKQN
jgi:hypothetical protein